ncbi:MAG: hypothetical protein JSW62_02365 [Thermoplasmatales archaeon]|nr:MAG: hypothetical protein JSW62_02365 [Thermoplasmatales archaeon]
MKKSIVVLGAVAAALLMISTATAVPQTQSEPVINVINDIEEKRIILEDNLPDIKSNGIIIDILTVIVDIITEIITRIINFIKGLIIEFIENLPIVTILRTLLQFLTDFGIIIRFFRDQIRDYQPS